MTFYILVFTTFLSSGPKRDTMMFSKPEDAAVYVWRQKKESKPLAEVELYAIRAHDHRAIKVPLPEISESGQEGK
jgi:hypothetical protein